MKLGRLFALASGFVFVLLGLAGFVPGLTSLATSLPSSAAQYGIAGEVKALLGLFPINGAESVFYITLGVLGLASAIALDSARLYAGFSAVILGLLAILGALPFSNTVFGLFPVYDNDVWLHGTIALVSAYFGFLARPDLKETLESEVG